MRYTIGFALALAILSPTWTMGAEVRIPVDTTWTMPRGVVHLGEDGTVGLVRIERDVNAVSDAKDFKTYSVEKKDYLPGGAKAWSNPDGAENVMDGRVETWWSPDPEDPLEDWQIEIDLGRLVAAKRVRLIFADTLGMKPFERFSVHVSDGARIVSTSDLSRYSMVGKETLPNRERAVAYDMTFRENQDTTTTGEPLIRTLDFGLVKRVRVVIEVPNRVGRPALAEVEVDAVGDNIALLTEENGGAMTPNEGADGDRIHDGDTTTQWGFTPVADTEWDKGISGTKQMAASFEWDLGATFWVDQIFLHFGEFGFYAGVAISNQASIVPGSILMASDGSPRPGGPLDWPPGGKYEYQLVADVDNGDVPYQLRFDHAMERRRVRHLFFRVAHGWGYWGRGYIRIFEMMIFGEGYPAKAVLTSQPVDLAKLAGDPGKRKSVSGLRWEADQPLFPTTRAEVRTRSGDTLDTLKIYYKKIGKERKAKEVTEEEYHNLRKVQKGDIEVRGFRPGEGWSPWSSVYPQSGPFLSPSSNKLVQFQVNLLTERPDVAPVLGGLYVDLTDPLVRALTGAVVPREVREVDQPLPYTYRIWPEADPGDQGFDRVLIRAPVVRDTVRLEINGKQEVPEFVEFGTDSLWIGLRESVKGDSVAVGFTAKVSRNGIVFDAFVGASTTGVWQRVDAATPGATLIFLPS